MQPLNDGRYESVAEFVHAATTECSNEGSRGEMCRLIDGDHYDWYGANCRTGRDVVEKLKTGWQEGRDKANAMLAGLDTSELNPINRKRRLTKGAEGDELDIQQVYCGNLERAWTTPKRRRLHGPQQVTILANMICHGREDADVLFWRGAAAIAVADKLEEAGYVVRIIVGFGGEHDAGGPVSCRITVKDHGAPLDITTTASVVLPGFFRAIGHAWICGHSVAAVTSCGISVQQGIIEEGEIFLSHEVRNEKTALDWCKKLIAKMNGESQEAA